MPSRGVLFAANSSSRVIKSNTRSVAREPRQWNCPSVSRPLGPVCAMFRSPAHGHIIFWLTQGRFNRELLVRLGDLSGYRVEFLPGVNLPDDGSDVGSHAVAAVSARGTVRVSWVWSWRLAPMQPSPLPLSLDDASPDVNLVDDKKAARLCCR